MRAPHKCLVLPRSRYVPHVTDVAQTIFGLRHVKNTPIGDAAIREYSTMRREEACFNKRGIDASFQNLGVGQVGILLLLNRWDTCQRYRPVEKQCETRVNISSLLLVGVGTSRYSRTSFRHISYVSSTRGLEFVRELRMATVVPIHPPSYVGRTDQSR
ncbi:hypothetical protein EDB87DRAFT_755716 [Lactarius vividus]|nr:hypothetical protein EDB87DRAFT_755716 [Lactarius vividus]